MSSIRLSGLVSGIDTDPIIEQLNRFNQQRLETLAERQQEAVDKQTIFKTIEARVLTLQSSFTSLAKARNGAFDSRVATSSDENILKAAANASATAGEHKLIVKQLAKANIEGSQGFAAQASEVKTGTLTISAGGTAKTITIDSNNNTLAGLAAEINAADVGVQATIIDDGSDTDPFRLLLRAENSGADNAISITNNLTGGSGTQPTFSEVQAAQDSQVQIGSGGGAITVNNSSNLVNNLIPGVTLDLQSADASKEVTITIANDTAGIQESVEGFVTEFNALIDFVEQQTRFDPETLTGGPLNGDRRILDLRQTITSAILSSNQNLPSNLNRLGAFGISISQTGRLSIDSGEFSEFLNGDFDDVRKAFALNGESNNVGVRFVFGSDKTQESGASPFQVNITQAAEQATITATSALASDSIAITSSNNSLTLSVSGSGSETITLTEGTYTRAELASELQTRIGADANVGRFGVSVTVNGSNQLVLTTGNYGSGASISGVSGTAPLGFDGSETDTGQDVAGNFIVGGVTETASGSGRVLRGDSDNDNTADINLIVDLTSSQISADVDAEISVTRGIAARLELIFDDLVDSTSGRLSSISDSFAKAVDAIDDQIAEEQETLDANTASLLRQFAALEDAIGRSRANGDLITNSLAPLLNRGS